ncbi:MAG: hypothetical protein VB039_03180 [Oscillospiraceae bacterium]|nr:hypothetical protein [Oscillospiraceae bacterium]
MKKELREKVIAYNAEKAGNSQAAADLEALMALIPNGQRKQLAKKAAVQEIFTRYGIEYS